MRVHFPHYVVAAVLVASAACYRYVERRRPVTTAECAPPQTPRALARHTADSSSPRAIRGLVVDASAVGSAARPLPGALVQVEQLRRAVQTDASGQFRVDSVAPGRYAVSTRRIGYHTRWDTVTVEPRSGTVLEIGLEPVPFDGCPGLIVVVERKRVWRWPWQ